MVEMRGSLKVDIILILSIFIAMSQAEGYSANMSIEKYKIEFFMNPDRSGFERITIVFKNVGIAPLNHTIFKTDSDILNITVRLNDVALNVSITYNRDNKLITVDFGRNIYYGKGGTLILELNVSDAFEDAGDYYLFF